MSRQYEMHFYTVTSFYLVFHNNSKYLRVKVVKCDIRLVWNSRMGSPIKVKDAILFY